MNGSLGISMRPDSTDPPAHISDEATQRTMPSVVAPPEGRATIATPTNPIPTPASACQGSRSPPSSRISTIQSGTEAMISDASPVGTLRSA